MLALTGPSLRESEGLTFRSCQGCLGLTLKMEVTQTEAEGQTGLLGDNGNNTKAILYSLDSETC